jgi:hypothetical protein
MAQLTEPFKPNVTLETTLPLTLWDAKPLDQPGMYYFFVGYRLADGTIIYTSKPIMVEVQ